ncbi:MAG: hypothetical protein WAQ28_19755 [Bacteroidia bacterium]
MKQIVLTVTLLLLVIYNSPAQNKIVLEGIYKGKSLYIMNSSLSGKDTCAEKVIINNKEFAFKNAKAFEIDPASLGFIIGDSLKITIFHKPDCKPSLLMNNATPKKETR